MQCILEINSNNHKQTKYGCWSENKWMNFKRSLLLTTGKLSLFICSHLLFCPAFIYIHNLTIQPPTREVGIIPMLLITSCLLYGTMIENVPFPFLVRNNGLLIRNQFCADKSWPTYQCLSARQQQLHCLCTGVTATKPSICRWWLSIYV